jgi:hypothetical protein
MHPALINPRVTLFLKAHGLPTSTLQRDENGDVRRISIGTVCLPWTLHFMLWMQLQWPTWARELGFRAVDDAQLAVPDHHLAFDAWLAARVASFCNTATAAA